MSSKIGLLLSMIFAAMFIAFAADLICIQFAYSNLDSKSVNISYLISNYGTIDEPLVNQIETTYNVDFMCLSNCNPKFGDTVNYQISSTYTPFIIKNTPMKIALKRSAIIGYLS